MTLPADTCDGCRKVVTSASKSRPAYWTGLDISAHAYDYQGAACADASVSRTLCRDCTNLVHDAVNAAITQARTALKDKTPNQEPKSPEGEG